MARIVFTDPEPRREHDELEETLRALQSAILQHPVAAQALFHAFVREGRAFAATPEGAEWQARLAGSELVGRARVLWDSMTVRALEDDPHTVLPTAILEAILKAAADHHMEHLLEDLFIHGVFER
jgi:hypothetical protein